MKSRETTPAQEIVPTHVAPRSQPRPLRLARLYRLPRWVHLMTLLGLILGTSIAYRVYDYTENDPDFCQSCHIMKTAWDRWATSEHRKVHCHACHQQSKLESLHQLWLTLVKRPKEVGPHAPVPPQVCAKCHLSHDPHWKQVAQTAGHKVHVEKEKIPCWRCHAKSIHRFRPPNEICQECHQKEHVEIAPMGRLHCTNCHPYLATQATLLPTRNDCLWCHQRQLTTQVLFKADSPMQFECQACHNPHRKQSPTAACGTCHGGRSQGSEVEAQQSQDVVLRLGAVVQESTHPSCLTCHRPHTWKTEGNKRCLACHNPLPKVFGHVPGHRLLQCDDCHQAHGWKTESEQLCQTCHRSATGG